MGYKTGFDSTWAQDMGSVGQLANGLQILPSARKLHGLFHMFVLNQQPIKKSNRWNYVRLPLPPPVLLPQECAAAISTHQNIKRVKTAQ
jgi:hypothetical protein